MSKSSHLPPHQTFVKQSRPVGRLRTPLHRLLLAVICILFVSMACDEPWGIIEYIRTGKWPPTPTRDPGLIVTEPPVVDEDPCWLDGDSLKYTGGFVPRPGNPWVDVTNTILLQFNTNCTDVYGYSDLIQRNSSIDRTETGTSRISFKGTYNPKIGKFEGTVYVDYDLICQGDCGEGYTPYSFDYPAVWNGSLDATNGTVTGWIDGIGDFKLDVRILLHGPDYKEVPGLDVWP